MRKGMNRRCDKCQEKRLYDERYDAWYCLTCDEWLEKECGDSNCFFCAMRPHKPSRRPKGEVNRWRELLKELYKRKGSHNEM